MRLININLKLLLKTCVKLTQIYKILVINKNINDFSNTEFEMDLLER